MEKAVTEKLSPNLTTKSNPYRSMELELKINQRTATMKMVQREGNNLTIQIDDQFYDVDIVKVSPQEYSILYQGKSYNIEVIQGLEPKQYHVNMLYHLFEVDVIDQEAKYQKNRQTSIRLGNENSVRSPMPGKMVRLFVTEGDRVETGDSLLVLSAMKMESEFKAPCSGFVEKIFVREGDVVDGDQLLITLNQNVS